MGQRLETSAPLRVCGLTAGELFDKGRDNTDADEQGKQADTNRQDDIDVRYNPINKRLEHIGGDGRGNSFGQCEKRHNAKLLF